jgi:hypothetical protein
MTTLSKLFTIPEKYALKTRYIEEDPGWCSIPKTSIQLSLLKRFNHRILDYIGPDRCEWMEPVLRRIAAEDGTCYNRNLYLNAVRPTREDISVLNRPGNPITLAWFVYGADPEEIEESVRNMIEWLESEIFVAETKKHRKLNKLLRQIWKLKSKSESQKLNAEEIAKLEREDAILEELEENDLDRRGPCH